jgi:thiol-disulfide isomerase/thioredoxin
METLDPHAFDGTTLRRPGRYVVAFSASWCPFCRAFLPKFTKLEGSPKFRVAVADLTDLESPLWERFQIEVVPSLAVFRDGEVVWRVDGTAGVGLAAADLRRARDAASS